MRLITPYIVVVTGCRSEEVGPVHSFEGEVRYTELGGCHHISCNNLSATVAKAGSESDLHYP